jgi:integrase
MKTELPIFLRKRSYYLRRTFEGKQREVALGKNPKIAQTRAIRFIGTADHSGFDTAFEELKGKPVAKAGSDPTFEAMKLLYSDFCSQSGNPPRPQTISHNLARLKCIMARGGFKTIGKIDPSVLRAKWFDGITPNQSQLRTFASAIKAAGSIFKKSALDYYESRKVRLQNPFKGLELTRPKVSQYVPISADLRESIWKDCATELDPANAMIVLMALGIGMRRSEIEAAIPSWFSRQADKVMVHIQEGEGFRPKNGQNGVVPISIDLYEALLKLRAGSNSRFFVPCRSKEAGVGRIWENVRTVNKWLKKRGLLDRKPLHALRKECGSIVAQNQGILEASKVLRNTPQVCAVHYAGIAEMKTLDIASSFTDAKDPIQAVADEFGISVDELKKKLSKDNIAQ